MSESLVGKAAPDFRLPAAQGGEMGLADFRGRESVVVWFTKGMACPFCRQHMSFLARGYPRFRDLGAEVLEVTLSTPARAEFYAKNFKLPFPYLCDPDYRVRNAFGLGYRSHSPVWYARTFMAAGKVEPPPSDFGDVAPKLGEFPQLLTDDDMGFFVIDRQGIVRHAVAGSYVTPGGVRALPSNDEIEAMLRACHGQGR
jgi:peroxiredoxin